MALVRRRGRPHHQRRGVLAGLALVLLAGCSSGSAGADSEASVPVASTTSWPSAGQQVTVVGLGDSVMESANCSCPGPVQDYVDLLDAQTGSSGNPVNLGAGGLTAAELAEELTSDAGLREAVHGADVVLVTIGANDVAPLAANWQSCQAACWASPLAALRKDMTTVLSTVMALRKDKHVPVLVSNYWNVLQDGAPATQAYGADRVQWSRQLTTATNQVIEDQARAAGATPVDLVVPFLGSQGDADPTDLLIGDGDHPNAEGVQDIAQAFLKATSF